MRVGFAVSDSYPENAGVYTYASELLRHFPSVDPPPHVVLLDGLGRRSREELRTTGGVDLPGAGFARPTRLHSILVISHSRANSLRSDYVLNGPYRYTMKLLYRVAAVSPRVASLALRPNEFRSVNVCHWSHDLFLSLARPASVATILNTIPLSAPQFCTEEFRQIETRRLKLIVRYATRVIAISDYTRADIVRHADIPEEKIDVIALAAARSFSPPTDPAAEDGVLYKYGLRRDGYVLCVGTIEPRKNLVRLANAFKSVIDRHPVIATKLVLVGKRGWLTELIDAGLEATGLGHRLVMLGRVPLEDLPRLFNGAAVVAQVSMYEGFGLPALEAMSCGAAMGASNVTSVPEVVENAGLLVAPESVNEIADAVERVLTDRRLRLDLRERGMRRSRLFSWEKTAHSTIETYRRATAEHGRFASV
jgi:glycosyltransferase involved in cell wall biosynthesis